MELLSLRVDGMSRLCMPPWSIVLNFTGTELLSGIDLVADVIVCIYLGEKMFCWIGVNLGSFLGLLTCSSMSWQASLFPDDSEPKGFN